MTLNSLDVQNKTFNTRMRGFDKHEVDEFLDLIVRDYDEFAQTLKDQERELKALRERVKYFDDMKDSLNKSIVVAQDAADNLRAQAKSEAETTRLNAEKDASDMIATAGQKGQLIIEAAKKEAGFILNAASEDARKLVRDTDDLKRKMRLYHQRMTSIIENQLASIQSDDWAEIFRPTEDPVVNPEEKLQEIIAVHLGEAEDTLAKTQAIQPLTDADLLAAAEGKAEEKPAEEATEKSEPEAAEEKTEAVSADEATSEAPEDPASEASETEAPAAEEKPAEPENEHELFPELEAEAPKAEENSIDNQETIDLSEVVNHSFKAEANHE